ncbi:hypothetical protein [Pseudodesulfovibrio sp. zrk46]|uniref:hypothetical protein n=1 Tax=Pseudodesulfovibrio sp. zrk46 TaxID=2725288 RepID=UPI0014495458|nr:hypothetical protein [Pseudodesulfovibrio sp. zrk46]QJB57332.1 hypothetical protein HFN16_13360 [Pseudodesulfovibrio sp. zrk46]
MLYVPIQIYPNERSVRSCVVRSAVFVGLAVAAFLNFNDKGLQMAVMLFCMVAFTINVLKTVAAATRQPMLKVLDDRFSVYTPFGYAMVRFGEVLAFRQGGIPGARTLRVEINKAARARFPSGVGRLLYSLAWLSSGNTVSIPAYMLGAQIDPVLKMLEKRRLAAVRLEAVEGTPQTVFQPMG